MPGAAYVVFGGATATGAIDTADLGTKGFTIVGPTRQRDRLGISVSAAGDVERRRPRRPADRADGVTNAATGNRNGGAGVVFGSASTDRVYTDPAATAGQSVFTCAGPSTEPGTCAAPGAPRLLDRRRRHRATRPATRVAGIGDVNGDEIPDFALGAYGFDPVNPAGGTISGAGAVYVVFGKPAAVTQSLGIAARADGYRIDGLAAGDRFGRQVGSIGDFDGNGTGDLAIGADFAARGGAQNGEVTDRPHGPARHRRPPSTVPADALVGDEVTFTATVTKPAGDQTAIAAGTVAFSLGGTPDRRVQRRAGHRAAPPSCTATFATGGRPATWPRPTPAPTPRRAPRPSRSVRRGQGGHRRPRWSSPRTEPATGQVVQLLARRRRRRRDAWPPARSASPPAARRSRAARRSPSTTATPRAPPRGAPGRPRR